MQRHEVRRLGGGEYDRHLQFETSKDWAPANLTATFKAGTNVTSQTVLGPSCTLNPHDPNPPVTPEPGALALLSLGSLPLLRVLRRRAG